ncbi:uncharacterized protein MKZ38_003063 [Zalerion maritima]|uniref:CoA-transferase family III n=1 Tax=Zalerion maritima TaxID=339359 RepID=A0AAD5RN02_9PEZI|nr:uncharacterized protein MKZ38_003063 [Zalerion maritima]
MLGDLGAEVIKIEHPVRGDDTRAWGPPYAPYKPESGHEGPGESAYYLGVNRNKKSLALSFSSPSGIRVLHRLAQKCDVLVENYLPNSLSKYHLDYPSLSALNPDLIYASITGYGQTGPYSSRAGYDVMVEAEFGLMHITGERDGLPVKVGVAVTDLTTGLYASNAIMAALLGRETRRRVRREGGAGGEEALGQWLDLSLSDCQTATLANIASSCLVSGNPDTGRWGTAHHTSILLGGGNDRLFHILADCVSLPQLKSHPDYLTNALRVRHRDELESAISSATRTKTTAEWLGVFEGKGMPYAAVNDVQTALRHPHTRARNMVVEAEHGACGKLELVNTPMKFSNADVGLRSPPPTLGEHTDEVLAGLLGMQDGEIQELRKEGAVR